MPSLNLDVGFAQGFPVQCLGQAIQVCLMPYTWEWLSGAQVVSTSVCQGDPCAPAAFTFTILLRQGAEIDLELLHSEATVLGVDFRQEGGLGIYSAHNKRRDQGLYILG